MIIGAGLAGLIAAQIFPNHTILEARSEPSPQHRALLRFRSDIISKLTGIPFRRVMVRKGIWFHGWHEPTITLANAYSRKVLGRLVDRSVWDVEPVTRWIAPETFYEQLIDSLDNRIHWNTKYEYDADEHTAISTAPLPTVLSTLNISAKVKFNRAQITVERFRVPRCNVYQTIYFPDPEYSMYRASITGDLLIVEHVDEPDGNWSALNLAFGIDGAEPLDTVQQPFGKIAPIDETARHSLISKLTTDHNIYSLGRFATWRNILLDDVVEDVRVIRRLINATDYERRLYAQSSID